MRFFRKNSSKQIPQLKYQRMKNYQMKINNNKKQASKGDISHVKAKDVILR